MNYSWRTRISSIACKFFIFISRLRKNLIKLDVGSAAVKSDGWITSDLPKPYAPRPLHWVRKGHLLLDATSIKNWKLYFYRNSIDRICTEHVFEHLDNEELTKVLGNIRYFLSSKGNLRIAVPDGNRPDIKYIDGVAPPIDGHKQLFTIDSLSSILESNGFIVKGLEYYKDQKFFINKYDEKDGLILRCFKNDNQVEFKYNNHYYTSIIVDCNISN